MPGLGEGQGKGGRQTDGEGYLPKLRRVVGNVSTEMHYFSPFLLKIYYKKRSWGRASVPLCAKGWGRGQQRPAAAAQWERASLPGALAHHLQVVLLQLGSKQGILVL